MPENLTHTPPATVSSTCRVVVIWIDWYPYHVARLAGLLQAPSLAGGVVGLEMVGGIGVHAGLKFREGAPLSLPVETLLPQESWHSASKWTLARLIWQRLNELRPETVLVPGYYTLPAVAAALWARCHGRKSVLMTESCAYDHKRSFWKEWFKRGVIHTLFGWAVVGGKDHFDYLQQLGFQGDRTVRFYDVVDNRMYADGVTSIRKSSTAEDHGLPENYFLFVGRLAPEKNVRGLLAAWLIYRFQGGRWPLVLAGDGPELPALKALIKGNAFQRDVHFAGLRTSTQLLPLYAFASCFVLASTLEPWGLVVNEAMASSLPVLVSSRCGSARDLVINGETGYTFNPANERLLAQLLGVIEAMPYAERSAMGERAARQVQTYSPERFGREIASIADAAVTPLGIRHAAGSSR